MSATDTEECAWIGIGSNLDAPVDQVRRAVTALGDLRGCRVEAVSTLYRNPPMGPPGQPDYVNAVVRLATVCAPLDLLDALQAIEAAHGRVRGGERWGARPLDLDILLYGRLRLATERLTIPHPGLRDRPFVVHPLAEIDPDLVLPGDDRVVGDLAHAVPRDGLEPVRSPEGGYDD